MITCDIKPWIASIVVLHLIKNKKTKTVDLNVYQKQMESILISIIFNKIEKNKLHTHLWWPWRVYPPTSFRGCPCLAWIPPYRAVPLTVQVCLPGQRSDRWYSLHSKHYDKKTFYCKYVINFIDSNWLVYEFFITNIYASEWKSGSGELKCF